jgi:hypothetical protein
MTGSKKAGENTGLFGQWLSSYIRGIPRYKDYLVYYDHGDPVVDSNVVAIKGIAGERVNRINQLSQVDIMVANPNHEILALVEIEEGYCSPKKIIGDTFSHLMCDRYSILQAGRAEYFSITPETHLIISGLLSPKGAKFKQLEQVIRTRIRRFSLPVGSIAMDNVEFIFKETIAVVLEELKIYFDILLHDLGI